MSLGLKFKTWVQDGLTCLGRLQVLFVLYLWYREESRFAKVEYLVGMSIIEDGSFWISHNHTLNSS